MAEVLKKVFPYFVVFLLVAGIGGVQAREIRGRVTDRSGKPPAGAMVYIEAYREGKGAFDFGFAVIDRSTPDGGFTVNIQWRRNAKIAYAVMAEGMTTTAGFDHIRYYDTHDLAIELDSIGNNASDCETRLVLLGFPFAGSPSLANRVRSDEYRPLLTGMLRAYKPLLDGTCSPPAGHDARLKDVDNLRKTIFGR